MSTPFCFTTSGGENSLSENWIKICWEYPELPIALGCSNTFPTLRQANALLATFRLKKESNLDLACESLLKFARGKNYVPQESKEVDYFDLLPNEILSIIFEWVLYESTFPQIKPYLLVSKRVYSIVRETTKRLEKESVYNIKGILLLQPQYIECEDNFLEYFNPSIKSMTDCDNRWAGFHGANITQMDLLGIRDYEDREPIEQSNPEVLARRLCHVSLVRDRVREAEFLGEESEAMSTQFIRTNRYNPFGGVHDVIWNHDKLVIKYPRMMGGIPFYRMYKSKKGHFTILDLMERIVHFYQTPLSSCEYFYLTKEIYKKAVQKLGKFPSRSLIMSNMLEQLSKYCAEQEKDREPVQEEVSFTLKKATSINSLDSVMDQTIYWIMIHSDSECKDYVPSKFINALKNGKIPKHKLVRLNYIYSIQFVLLESRNMVCCIDYY